MITHTNLHRVERLPVPVNDLVLCRLEATLYDPEPAMYSGLWVRKHTEESWVVCRVEALGTGYRDDDGDALPFPCAVGDQVLVNQLQYWGAKLEHGDDLFFLMRAKDLLAHVEIAA